MIKAVDMEVTSGDATTNNNNDEHQHYSKLHSTVVLIDLCVNDRDVFREQWSDVQHLLSSLKSLNSQIREITGYNLLITKLKETIVTVTTKWQLLKGAV
jgi:hypothetical protein